MLTFKNNLITFPATKIFPQGSSFNISSMPALLSIFNSVVDTQSSKEAVGKWVSNGFDVNDYIDVMYSVIVKFGGGHRVWGASKERFEKYADENNNILRDAYHLANKLDYSSVNHVRKITGIGPTYATKFARFFNENFAILDSRIKDGTLYDMRDYDDYISVCNQISSASNLPISEVESCLFCFIQIKTSNKLVWKKYRNSQL